MRKPLTLLLVLSAGFIAACAGPGYGHSPRGHYPDARADVARAAYHLDAAANDYYRQLRHTQGYSHATRDAEGFARAASHFHAQVRHGSRSRHLQHDYEQLLRAYVHVRRNNGGRYAGYHNRRYHADFHPVERAFENLDRAIEYANGGRHDRRYDPYGRDDRYGRHRGYLSQNHQGDQH